MGGFDADLDDVRNEIGDGNRELADINRKLDEMTVSRRDRFILAALTGLANRVNPRDLPCAAVRVADEAIAEADKVKP